MSDEGLRQVIENATGQKVGSLQPSGHGNGVRFYKIKLADGAGLFLKNGAGASLDTEGWMLKTLGEHDLPVPDVIYAGEDVLLMSDVGRDDGLSTTAQRDVADHLAKLHSVTSDKFGLERDTVIGAVEQPNTQNENWPQFFYEQRLYYSARKAYDEKQISADLLAKVERLEDKLPEWLPHDPKPSLVHGDMWGGNQICRDGKVVAFIDPAIYFADPETELAFATLFGAFGPPFFERYQSHRPIEPDFFDVRKDIYNLYPILVHARLFGGVYEVQAAAILRRFVG